MATTDRDVRNALRRAAEKLLGRPLTESEADDLVRRFRQASGSYPQRVSQSLREFTRLSDDEYLRKSLAYDNTDRIITDLHDVLNDWNPGT